MSLSIFEHPLLSAYLNCGEIADLFTVEAEIETWLTFETELARAEADCGLFDYDHVETIAVAAGEFAPDMDRLHEATQRDGVPIPGFIEQLRVAIGGESAAQLHMGATSQDVIDTSLMMRLKKANVAMIENLVTLGEALDFLIRTHGEKQIMGVTRMQNALPIAASTRFGAWAHGLQSARAKLEELSENTFALQLGGPVGDNQVLVEKAGDKANEIREKLADFLELSVAEGAWHATRERLGNYASALSLATGALGKIGMDIALMAYGDQPALVLSGGGGSSVMEHKKNPVLAESLVALARFNASQLGAMHQAQIHELERSGISMTLEWMVLPQMVAATASAIGNTEMLLSMIEDVRGI